MTRRVKAEARRARAIERGLKAKRILLEMTDLPNMVDAVFEGDYEMSGWVNLVVNTKGRECVEALFPQAYIAWRDAGPGFPADWQGFTMNLPDVVSQAGPNKLPDITGGANLDDAAPEALAFLLAAGVKHQGGRSATWDGREMMVFTPREN